ncbi:MAG: MotA/TolQ/ExbB proton channel family protein [Verrucomicrobiales bacterium]
MKFHSFRRWLQLLPAVLLATVGSTSAFAQAAADAPPVAGKSLWEEFLIGGLFMWPILALNIALVGLVVYNSIALSKKRWIPDDLKAALLEQMSSCRVRSAIETASASPSYLGRMSALALPKIDATAAEGLGREHVEDAMAEFVNSETREPVMWVNYFSTIMQAAPMLGLLGTVSGMVGAFAGLAANQGSDPSVLANKISEALYTTYFGLVVAIPALVCYAIFKNLFNARVAVLLETGTEMLDSSVNAIQGEQLFAKVPEGLHAE